MRSDSDQSKQIVLGSQASPPAGVGYTGPYSNTQAGTPAIPGRRSHTACPTKILLAAICLLVLSACAWKPPCPVATITEPWERMNLPINKDAAVCLSTATKFQAAHKADRETVTKMYLDSLEKNGWKVTARDLSATYHFDFERGTESITLEVYEWQKTGVLLKKR